MMTEKGTNRNAKNIPCYSRYFLCWLAMWQGLPQLLLKQVHKGFRLLNLPVQASEATGVGTSTPVEIVPIPVSSIQIEGIPYKAYQIPGDPFRFVCQEPCPLDPQYIFAEYAGFRPAHATLIQLTGVDTLTELQPVDMHLVFEDSICQELPAGHAYVYSDTHKAYTCTDGPGYYPTIEEKIRKAAQPEDNIFLFTNTCTRFSLEESPGRRGISRILKRSFSTILSCRFPRMPSGFWTLPDSVPTATQLLPGIMADG